VRMTLDIRELYQPVILAHHKSPRNRRFVDGAVSADGDNRACGDRITVHARIEDGVIRDTGFQGSACAIATASASLMTEWVTGKTVDEAHALYACLRRVLRGADIAAEDFGDLLALAS